MAALVAVLAVAGLAVALTLATRPMTAGAADSEAGSSRIVMTGTADAHVVPDQLTFDLVAHVEEPDLSAALQHANDAMRTAMDTLEHKGVDAKDIASTGLDMSPVYDYADKHQTLKGYQVDQRARVTVHDLDKAGGLISDVVSGGGNAVRAENIALSVSDPDAALASARRDAVENATAKAKQYADAAGRSLGSVVSIAEPTSSRTPQPMVYASSDSAAAGAAAAPVPISAGQQTMTVSVTITWSLG